MEFIHKPKWNHIRWLLIDKYNCKI